MGTGKDVVVGPGGGRSLIRGLSVGDDVDAVFACAFKERRVARGGRPFLSLRLRDRSGTITGRVFGAADEAALGFEAGDLVGVRGKVEIYRGVPFVLVRRVWRVEQPAVESGEFLPVAWRDVDELDGFLDHLAGQVAARDYRALLAVFFEDRALRAEFRRAPCTAEGHHAYLGGLLEHSVAVATLTLETSVLHAALDADLLLTAALLHDIGKIREFAYGTTIAPSPQGKLVGHLVVGQQLVAERASSIVKPGRLHALQHCIQGHHGPMHLPTGRYELDEAVALYRLNAADADLRGATARAGQQQLSLLPTLPRAAS
jgi:3'-5' exoribonuclease